MLSILSRFAALSGLALLAGCELPKYEFNLTRLNMDGSEYQGTGNYAEKPWACVRDNKTGLTWEIRTATPGLQSSDNTYTWYSRDEYANLGYEGKLNGGACAGSRCDTEAYIAAINELRLCGFGDWRLPSNNELSSIVDTAVRFPGPTVPAGFFPDTRSAKDSGYWTGTSFDKHSIDAWAWRFDHGMDYIWKKELPLHVRLVRGETKKEEEKK